jgi:hypothetical protein
MRLSKLAMLLVALPVFLQACCCLHAADPCEHISHRHAKACSGHPEPKFDLPKQADGVPPSGGVVFGTSDFDSSGTVLIKIQVEDSVLVPGSEATITAWSGYGEHPASTSTPPAGGTQVYATSGDVNLPFWTSHLDRTYNPSVNKYWLFVRVDQDTGNGRDVDFFWYEWTNPSQLPSPDPVREFHMY